MAGGRETPLSAVAPSRSNAAVFLSYARDDADAARAIADALQAAGLEVWFDERELAGGEAWDRKIRAQIKQCALFMPLISAHTDARTEGYFRLEWKLAVERTHLLADDAPFLVPVVLDGVAYATARVPDKFREVHWTPLASTGDATVLVAHVTSLLQPSPHASSHARVPAVRHGAKPRASTLPVPATPLVGRTRELAELRGLLTDPTTRLLTLSGPGGIGKTRLAFAAVQAVSGYFRDGLTFVDLSAVRDPALLAPSLARALQLRELPGREPLPALKEALRDRQVPDPDRQFRAAP
jgi:hypothetical protein